MVSTFPAETPNMQLRPDCPIPGPVKWMPWNISSRLPKLYRDPPHCDMP